MKNSIGSVSSDFSWKRQQMTLVKSMGCRSENVGGGSDWIGRGWKVNTLCSFVGRRQVLHGFLSATGLGIARISPVMIVIAVATLTAVLFTAFNIQTKVHGIPLRFFSIVLGNLEENTNVVDRLWTGVLFRSFHHLLDLLAKIPKPSVCMTDTHFLH